MSKVTSGDGETKPPDKYILPGGDGSQDERQGDPEKSLRKSSPPIVDFISSQQAPSPPPKDAKYVEKLQQSSDQSEASKNNEEKKVMPDKSENLNTDSGLSVAEDRVKHAFARNSSNMEIQTIMEQFNEGKGGVSTEDVMAQRAALTSPTFLPPRTSSLEKQEDEEQSSLRSPAKRNFQLASPTSQNLPSPSQPTRHQSSHQPSLPRNVPNTLQQVSLAQQPPLPEPEPEPELPFDFHRFLEQLRHRTADPVAKFLRSFLNEFGKKQWMVHEQVKIISDFLEFISKKMAQCEVWRTVSDVEFDNAKEGMEKLVMNRLYSQTFSPVIPPETAGPSSQPKGPQSSAKPGRRGQHQEDVERDDVLAQKMRIYAWVSENHLDIKPLRDKGSKFLGLAQKELLKINTYRAPRDKIICILNCCKVIFGFLRASQSDQSADSFIPLLIYTVLRAKPEHLVSNVQYILRFRNQDKLSGEAGYYISSLTAAVQFIETIDRTSLTISDEDFEKQVENAVSVIAERPAMEPLEPEQHQPASDKRPSASSRLASPHRAIMTEKSTISRPEVTPRNSLDAERITPKINLSPRKGNSVSSGAGTSDDGDEGPAVAGLLRSIQRPLSSIGRMFSDDPSLSQRQQREHRQPYSDQRRLQLLQTAPRRSSADPPTIRTSRRSEDASQLAPGNRSHRRRSSEDAGRSLQRSERDSERTSRDQMTDEDAAASQASSEMAEAQRIQRAEHRLIVDTLAGMFPDLDREVIDDVVRVKEERVGLAVDACLALSN